MGDWPKSFADCFDNDDDGHRQLIKQLPDAKSCLVVIEATGGYEKRIVLALVDAGYVVSVVNPRQVCNYAKALGILAKTNKIDGGVIARFGHDVRPRAFVQTHEKQDELDQLVTRRRQLVALRTSVPWKTFRPVIGRISAGGNFGARGLVVGGSPDPPTRPTEGLPLHVQTHFTSSQAH